MENKNVFLENTDEFQKEIAPFFWVDHESSASVCLTVGDYLMDVFATRANEGFTGNGYEWESLAQVFLNKQCPELVDKIAFDPEGSMFAAYSKDKKALKDFIRQFKRACDNHSLILDLFKYAEPD